MPTELKCWMPLFPEASQKRFDGTMSVMVGGKKEIFERCYDILMLAGSVVYVGELAGQRGKACKSEWR